MIIVGLLIAFTACIPVEDPPLPCYEGDLPQEFGAIIGDSLSDCSQLDEERVCNSASTLAEDCERITKNPFTILPQACELLPQIEPFQISLGTCQPPGTHSQPCGEDTDCRTDLNLQCSLQEEMTAGKCEPDSYPPLTRLIYVYHRLSHLSISEFLQYWQEVHAPQVLEKADLLGIKGYKQLHSLDPIINLMVQMGRGTLPAYDGVGELWIDLDLFVAALETPEGQAAMEALIEDKHNFADLPRSALWLAEEQVIRKKSRAASEDPVMIFTWVGSPLPSLTPQEFQHHYLYNHGVLVGGYAEQMGIREYVQYHSLHDPLNDTLQAMHGTSDLFYVHAQFLWDFTGMLSLDAMFIMLEVAEDEQRFIDFSSSAMWMTIEQIILPAE